MHDASAHVAVEARRRGSPTWRSLLPPFAVSLLLHAAVLALLGLLAHPQRQAGRPERAVSLTAVIVDSAPVPPAPSPEPSPQPADASRPVAPSVPPEAVPAAPSPTAVAAAAASPPSPAAPPPEPSRPPIAQDDPFAGQVHPDLVNRRLAAKVWIREDGTVDEARVKANEIAPETSARIEEALSRVRFAADAGEAAGARRVVDMLLCFGERGVLDTAPDDCWSAARTAPR